MPETKVMVHEEYKEMLSAHTLGALDHESAVDLLSGALAATACTTGVPRSPHSRMVWSIGICASSGAFAKSATACPPPAR